MPKVKATKPKIKPPIEISDDEFLSTSSTSLSFLDGHREDREEQVEEVDENSSSLISIGGFILGLVAFTFGISYLIAYSL